VDLLEQVLGDSAVADEAGDEPAAATLEGAGGLLFLECVSSSLVESKCNM
jgi:hypothetical protein